MQAGAATPSSSFFLPSFHPPKSSLSSIPNFTFSKHPPRLPKKPRNGKISVGVSTDQPSTTSSQPTTSTGTILSASDVVKEFYKRINARELGSVEELIADACVYEDLVFARPFVGRQAILDFFKEFTNAISSDLQFVIDDISNQDLSAIGVTWHLEWKGRPFPFSKGCSFYRLELVDGRRQIVYGRDIVEPAFKPGKLALDAIRGVTFLLQKFPQLADRF